MVVGSGACGREESRVLYQDLFSSLGMETESEERPRHIPYRAGDKTRRFYLEKWSER